MTELESFVRRWQREVPITARVFRAVPEARFDYRPHPRSRSARQLVALIAYEVHACIELLDSGELDWEEPSGAGQRVDELLDALDRAHAEVVPRLKRLDEAAWARPARLKAGGQVLSVEPLGEILWTTLLDLVHHRGQLSVYLRPMGGRVPAIYGSSADEAGTRVPPDTDTIPAGG